VGVADHDPGHVPLRQRTKSLLAKSKGFLCQLQIRNIQGAANPLLDRAVVGSYWNTSCEEVSVETVAALKAALCFVRYLSFDAFAPGLSQAFPVLWMRSVNPTPSAWVNSIKAKALSLSLKSSVKPSEFLSRL
jgi:hypothetical protein